LEYEQAAIISSVIFCALAETKTNHGQHEVNGGGARRENSPLHEVIHGIEQEEQNVQNGK
jgi:hypothetical protein